MTRTAAGHHTESSLAALFPSRAMARLVVFFAVHSGGRFHLRELLRRTGLSSASLQTELRRLVRTGAVRRAAEGARTLFAADEAHPAWRAWMLLLRSSADPVDVLREVLVDAGGLDAAFLFGSEARGESTEESDLDVLLVGSDDARRDAALLLSDAQLLVRREMDVVGYDRADLSDGVRSGNAFLTRVMAGPKLWLRGGPADVRGEEGG